MGGSFGGFGIGEDGRYFDKVVLRLDAFLGEWLSPEYFEMISPPPPSSTMVTIAKTELLRREDYSRYADPSLQMKSVVGYWKACPKSQRSEFGREGLDLSSMAQALSGTLYEVEASTDTPTDTPTGYLAPSPHYAISNNAKIPDGYVAHARDACVQLDLQWDSGNTPLNWGDGGTYGEEWTAMHRRFRNGVQSLVDWYLTTENPAEIVSRVVEHKMGGSNASVSGLVRGSPSGGGAHPGSHADQRTANGSHTDGHTKGDEKKCQKADVVAVEDDIEDTEGEDEEEEFVVILVSHGAGCNALIGAITHQPALMDVGMASLTMAARKPVASAAEAGHEERASLLIYQRYDMKITANSDHLRSSSSTTPMSSRTPSGVSMTGRGRMSSTGGVGAPAIGPFKYAEPHRSNSASASFAPVRLRSNSRGGLSSLATGTAVGGTGTTSPVVSPVATPFSALSTHHRQPSLGLWSPIQPREEDEDEDDYFPDFDNKRFAREEDRKHEKQQQHEAPKGLGIRETDFAVSELVASPVAATPRSPPLPVRRPSRKLSESSDDFMSAQLGFPTVSNGGGLWSSSRESSRRWTIDEAM